MSYIFATDPLIVKRLLKWTINKQGYDKIGSYWGIVLDKNKIVPVWTFELYYQATGNKLWVDETVRAKNKTEAKKKIKARFPAVKKFVLD